MGPETKTYRIEPDETWFLKNRRYLLYMLREVSALFVLLYTLFFLALVLLVVNQPALFRQILPVVDTLPFQALTGVVLAFVVLHAVTWWFLTGKTLRIRLGGRVLSPQAITALGFVAWGVVSVVVYVLIFEGQIPGVFP